MCVTLDDVGHQPPAVGGRQPLGYGNQPRPFTITIQQSPFQLRMLGNIPRYDTQTSPHPDTVIRFPPTPEGILRAPQLHLSASEQSPQKLATLRRYPCATGLTPIPD